MFEQLVVLVAHAISGIYSSDLKYSKKTTFFVWGIWVVFQVIIGYFSEFVIKDIGMKFFLGFVTAYVFQYIIFFATTKGRFSQRLFTILTYSIFFCIFMALFMAIQGAFPGMYAIVKTIIHATLMVGVIFYFLKCVCPLCRAASKSIVTGWYQLVFVNCIFVITIVATSVFPVKITSIYMPEFVPFLFLSISIFAVYPVIFSNIKNMTEVAVKRETEQQNELLLLQIEKENLQMAQERRIRHDRRHHNRVLLEFANKNDIETVKDYLKTLVDDDSDNLSEISGCKNPTINTVLSVYEKKAKEAGIKVKIAARAGHDIPVSPKDLVIVIANLFENAINATKKIKTGEKLIDIDIREKENRLLVKIENPCKANLRFDESNYGIGINSVITATNKYEGMIDFTVKNEKFISKICLNF
jgi:hypothetical protein